MQKFKENIAVILNELGVTFTEPSVVQLSALADSILEFNNSLNLVSKKDPMREVIKQIADSAAFLKYLVLEADTNLLDIGSGAGFPGLALKILHSDLRLISLDSNPKKIIFQEKIVRRLMLSKCELVARPFREYYPDFKFAWITVKALGQFQRILTYARQYLEPKGKIVFFLSEKTPEPLANLNDPEFHIKACQEYSIPGYSGVRRLLVIEKAPRKTLL